MNSLLATANSTDKYTGTGNNQKGWNPGAQKGALYKVPKGLQDETAQHLINHTLIAKQKTIQWMHEAKVTEAKIDLGEIVKALQWTSKDIADVAIQSNQLVTVNLQRENIIWQLHCCDLIREVTKQVIRSTTKLAYQKINPLNDYQKKALNSLEAAFLKEYLTSGKPPQSNIEQEELKSQRLRLTYLQLVSLLIKDPLAYEARIIKENTKLNIESAYQEMCSAAGLTKEISLELDKIKARAISALNAIEITNPENMIDACASIVAQINRTTATIFCCLNLTIQHSSGRCKAEARITDYN